MDLQEDVDYALVVGPPALYGIQKMDGIHRLDKRDIRKDKLQLIGLKMADEVPIHVGGHQRNLCCKLLRAAFGKDALAGIIGFTESLHRMELGHSNKRHPLWK